MSNYFFITSLWLAEHGMTIFLIALPVVAFIICYLWTAKLSPPGWKRIPMALGLTVMSTPVMLIALILYIFISSMHLEYNFSRKRWMNNTEKRYRYSESIIESEMLIGKTKEEVQKLLGDHVGEDDKDIWQ